MRQQADSVKQETHIENACLCLHIEGNMTPEFVAVYGRANDARRSFKKELLPHYQPSRTLAILFLPGIIAVAVFLLGDTENCTE